jgi:hypothetical protein
MGRDYVSELLQPKGLLFIFQTIYEYGATVQWYWQNKTEELGKNPSTATLCITNPTWTDPGENPGENPGLRADRTKTNRLSHGTANETT